MEMNNPEIKFYRFLSDKLNLSKDDAETFITLQKEVQADSLATKGNLADLRTDLKGDIADLKTEISDLRTEVKSDFSTLKTKITESSASLKVSMERYRTNILWVVVLFWLAQVGVFLGFAYKLFPGL